MHYVLVVAVRSLSVVVGHDVGRVLPACFVIWVGLVCDGGFI